MCEFEVAAFLDVLRLARCTGAVRVVFPCVFFRANLSPCFPAYLFIAMLSGSAIDYFPAIGMYHLAGYVTGIA